ncbi:MAG TPA: M56 family metallopeptidase [Armatimonadota bacterium]
MIPIHDVWIAVGLGALWRASWQGGLVLLLAWGISRLWRRMPPLARVWLWRVAYVKLLLSFCWAGSITLILLPSPAPKMIPLPPAVQAPATSPAPISASPVPMPAGPTSSAPTAAASHPAQLLAPRGLALAGVGLLWLLGALWSCWRVRQAWRQSHRLLRACRPVEDETILRLLLDLTDRAQLPWPPDLRMGDLAGPILLGSRRPTILIPEALAASEQRAALRLVLAHELAHLRQRDLPWGWIGLLAQVLFFFHPLVWIGLREWQLAQETAGDARALQWAEAGAGEYGEMLVDAAARAAGRRQPALVAVGVSESFRTLRRRLSALAELRVFPRTQLVATALALVLLACFTLPSWRVAAQSPKTLLQATLAIQPYAEMTFTLNTPLTTDEAICRQQYQLYQALPAGTAWRVAAQQKTVTIIATGITPQQTDIILQTATSAMMQVFGHGTFRAPAARNTVHLVDTATREAVNNALTKRLQAVGYTGISVREESGDRLLIQAEAPGGVKTLTPLLGQGRLEFWLLPANLMVSFEERNQVTVTDKRGNQHTEKYALEHSFLVMDGHALKSDCRVTAGRGDRPVVNFSLATPDDSKWFAWVTQHYIGRQLAIVLDDHIIMAPAIKDRISTGNGIITGKYTWTEAEQLAAILNAGVLPAPVTIVPPTEGVSNGR